MTAMQTILKELSTRVEAITADAVAKVDSGEWGLAQAEVWLAEQLAEVMRQAIQALIVAFTADRTIRMLGGRT